MVDHTRVQPAVHLPRDHPDHGLVPELRRNPLPLHQGAAQAARVEFFLSPSSSSFRRPPAPSSSVKRTLASSWVSTR